MSVSSGFKRVIGRLVRLAFGLCLVTLRVEAEPAGGGLAADSGASGGLISLELFVEQGCDQCVRFHAEVLPGLERDYAGGYQLREFDIAWETNYLRMVSWRVRLGVTGNAPLMLVVDGRQALCGLEAIREGLAGAMEGAISARLAGGRRGGGEGLGVDRGVLQRHVAGFTVAGIIVAAAVDSMNPCMVATLVFFLSLLSVSHIGARRMALAGGAFVVACGITYYLLGLGLLGGLRMLGGVAWARGAIHTTILVTLTVFAVLSFVDAIRYGRTGRAGDVLLRLPDGLQGRVHRVMKRGLRARYLLAGGFGIGVVVTLVESVCTGQVYVPALALMIRSGQSVWTCAGYLGLYNLVFVLPLAILLALTCIGVGVPALVAWSRRNVVVGKVLLGLFFVGMALMVALG